MKYGQIVLRQKPGESNYIWGNADSFCSSAISCLFFPLDLRRPIKVLIEAFDLPGPDRLRAEVTKSPIKPWLPTRAAWCAIRIRKIGAAYRYNMVTINLMGTLGIEPETDTYFYVKATPKQYLLRRSG